ncbi:EAL domain-containing protein [Planomicrobium sp. CPCC 101110]|nr:EAL domain-containing protein [Planomicrobium sp. CPCC 101110]
MNTVDIFLIAIDNKGTVLRVNQAWLDFCEEHEVRESLWKVGSDYFKQLKEHGKLNELQAIQRVLNNESAEHKQMYPFLLKNGETQWFMVRLCGIELLSTKSRGAIIYLKPAGLHDIEPITAESILESMTDGFALLNDQFQIDFMNEVAESMLHCNRENVIGANLFDIFPEAVGTSFHQIYQQAMKEQQTIKFFDYYQPLNTWFQVKACPLKRGGLVIYIQDISEQKKMEEKLSASVNYDYLTELPNRRLLTARGHSLIEQKKKFTVFYLNVTNLKHINAMYDHDVGDALLKDLAKKLNLLRNDKCEVGRLDGDEFAVIYEPEFGEKLEGFAKQIKGIFEEAYHLHDTPPLYIEASIGISCFPHDSKVFNEVFSYAETAMHEAKKTSGSSYMFFRPSMHMQRSRKSTIEKSLTGNLKAIGLYYTLQPQINGSSGEVVGVEVLARWNHPELGELSPLEFIKIAEETSTITPLTLYLIEKVFVQLNEWQRRFGWIPRTAVNMTSSLLASPVFFDAFFELQKRYKIPSSMVEIEITEQAELTYSEATLKNLLLCKSKGISIAIDDFGTGFSMISYLTHFPITKIKIDRSFIQKIGQDKKSEAVLKSLIHLAKSIECDLVAEGVERPEEVAFLKMNDCTVYQGYLYDKPLKVHDFEIKYLQQNYKFQENKLL